VSVDIYFILLENIFMLPTFSHVKQHCCCCCVIKNVK